MKNILQEPVEIRLAKAKNPATDQEILSILSKDSFWFVRDFVAMNPTTRTEDLLYLLNDPDFRIRNDAKKNLEKKDLDTQILYAARIKSTSSPKESNLHNQITSDQTNVFKNPTTIER